MSLFNKKKKIKYIRCYLLKNKSVSEDKIYTITASEDECLEYLDNYMFYSHQDHYISWCDLRNLNSDDAKSWLEYKNANLIEDIEKFSICTVNLSVQSMFAIFRMFNMCVPIGCKFELPIEMTTYLAKMNIKEENK